MCMHSGDSIYAAHYLAQRQGGCNGVVGGSLFNLRECLPGMQCPRQATCDMPGAAVRVHLGRRGAAWELLAAPGSCCEPGYLVPLLGCTTGLNSHKPTLPPRCTVKLTLFLRCSRVIHPFIHPSNLSHVLACRRERGPVLGFLRCGRRHLGRGNPLRLQD